MRHLAGRKDDEHAAVLEMAQRLAHRADVGGRGDVALERIDEDEQLAQLGDAVEQEVGHDLHVRPDRRQKRREHHALDPAERMIRHHDDRPGARDLGQIRLRDAIANLQILQAAVSEFFGRFGAGGGAVDVVDAVEPEDALQRRAGVVAKLPQQRAGGLKVDGEEPSAGRLRRPIRAIAWRHAPIHTSPAFTTNYNRSNRSETKVSDLA
jgi:hypothetical protein